MRHYLIHEGLLFEDRNKGEIHPIVHAATSQYYKPDIKTSYCNVFHNNYFLLGLYNMAGILDKIVSLLSVRERYRYRWTDRQDTLQCRVILPEFPDEPQLAENKDDGAIRWRLSHWD